MHDAPGVGNPIESGGRQIMKTQYQWLILALVAAAGVLFGAAAASAQTTVEATAEWGAPTTGTPVVDYVVQLSADGGTWETIANTPDTIYGVDLETGHSYRVRVAGIDAEGRQGPWSLPSEPYIAGDIDPGPPGAPGQPVPL